MFPLQPCTKAHSFTWSTVFFATALAPYRAPVFPTCATLLLKRIINLKTSYSEEPASHAACPHSKMCCIMIKCARFKRIYYPKLLRRPTRVQAKHLEKCRNVAVSWQLRSL